MYVFRTMYTNYKQFDRDGRKKNLREGLPAYAYSRYLQFFFFLTHSIFITNY